MGLEEFMGDLGVEPEEPKDSEKDDKQDEVNDRYKYTGDKELRDISSESIWEIIKQSGMGLEQRELPLDGDTWAVDSPQGNYVLCVSNPTNQDEVDCILVCVLESQTMYDVIEPYKVFPTAGWKDELKQALDAVVQNDDDVVFCNRCGAVRIIRKTNIMGNRIRGCSNYPDCRNKEIL